ncbi:helix-turn-helix domain-containing protein [Desulfurobacterium sp.]
MKDSQKPAIGERLKQLRRRLGKTQKEFAEALGIHPMTLSKYESGKWVPSDKFLRLIEAKFDVNYNWLLKGEGTMFNFGIQALKERTTTISKLLELAEIDVALKVLTDKLIESLQHEGILDHQDKKLIKVLENFIYRRLASKTLDIYTEVLTQLAVVRADAIEEKDLISGGNIAKELLKDSILMMLEVQKELAKRIDKEGNETSEKILSPPESTSQNPPSTSTSETKEQEESKERKEQT